MKKFLALVALLIGFSFHAWAAGGTCANFNAGVCPASVPSGTTSFYFFDYVGGNDSNAGNSESSPWQHMPGCSNAAGNSATHTPGAGEGWILKGGVHVDFHCYPANVPWGGTISAPDYMGPDPGWFTGASWSRYVIDGGGSTGFVANTAGLLTDSAHTANYVVIDNPELTGLYWNGACPNGPASCDYISQASLFTHSGSEVGWEVKNAYMHNVTHCAPATCNSAVTTISNSGSTVTVHSATTPPNGNTIILGGYSGGFTGYNASCVVTSVSAGVSFVCTIQGLTGSTSTTGGFWSGVVEPGYALIWLPQDQASSIHDSYLSNIDGSDDCCQAANAGNMYNNYQEGFAQFVSQLQKWTVHDNYVTSFVGTFVPQPSEPHGNCIHLFGTTNTGTYTYIANELVWNNRVDCSNANAELNELEEDTSSVYEWNNVYTTDAQGNGYDLGSFTGGAGHGGTYTFFNNTQNCGVGATPSSICIGLRSGANVNEYNQLGITNNGSSAPAVFAHAPYTGTFTSSPNTSKTCGGVTTTNYGGILLCAPIGTGNGTGNINATQTYPFAPLDSTAATTVGSGTNESAICTTIGTINAAAGGACMADTTLGVTPNSSTHTVSWPARTPVARGNGSWTNGAYQFVVPASSGNTTISGGTSVSGVATLGGVGTATVVNEVDVSPPNPAIPFSGSIGFTANAVYTDGSSADVTSSATWTSSNTSVATNVASCTNPGCANFQCLARGTVTVQASFSGVNGTTTLSCQSPTFTPQGTINVAQSSSSQTIQIFTGANGTSPFTFSSPDLPGFTSLSSSGCAGTQVNCALVGTPATLGIFNFHLQLTDNLGNVACPAPGCVITLNVLASTSEDNKYCTLVSNVETVTGLSQDGPAQPLTNCNFTATSWSVLGGSPTVIFVCPVGQLSSGTSVPGCANAPQPVGSVVPAVTCANGSVAPACGAQPYYSATIQGAVSYVANTSGCGSDIQLYPTIDDAVPTSAINVYTEPTVIAPANINCGPDFGANWWYIRTKQFANLPPPGNRISPSWVGVSAVPGRPSFSQTTQFGVPAGTYMPEWRCEYPTGSVQCTVMNSQMNSATVGGILSGLRIMGVWITQPEGRDASTDIYGKHVCNTLPTGGFDCSPGNVGPMLGIGCNIQLQNNCNGAAAPITAISEASTTVTAASTLNPGIGNSIYIPFTISPLGYAGQYVVTASNSTTFQYTSPNTGLAAGTNLPNAVLVQNTNSPHGTGSQHVIIDRVLISGCPDLATWSTCYDDSSLLIAMVNGQHLSLIDSYLIGGMCMYGVGPCVEGKAVSGGNPVESINDLGFKDVDDFLEGSSENIFFGGGTATAGLFATDVEIRRNHFWKTLLWKADDPSFVGKVQDFFANNSRNGSGYSSSSTCTVDPPLSGTTATCSPIITTLNYPLTNIVGNGTTATVTCNPNCGNLPAAGNFSVTGNSIGGFNVTNAKTVTVSGTNVTSFTFASSTSGTGTGGSLSTGEIGDVQVVNKGSGYGIRNKANGSTYAAAPNIYFTDGSNTFTTCANQLSGNVNTNGTDVQWAKDNKFIPGLVGTQITINNVNYLVTVYNSNIDITISTSAGTQTNVAYSSNLPSRADCFSAMIGTMNVKNAGEFKNMVRALLEGNIHENVWVGQSDQAAFCFLLSPKNANNLSPTATIQDVTFRYNFCRNMVRGLQVILTFASQGSGCGLPGCLAQYLTRVSVHDDIFDSLTGPYWTSGTAPLSTASGTCIELLNEQALPYAVSSFRFNHIDCIATENPNGATSYTGSSFITAISNPNPNIALMQNIVLQNSIGTGGIKNTSSHGGVVPGLPMGFNNCSNNACTDQIISHGPTEVAMRQAFTSDYEDPASGGLYTTGQVMAITITEGGTCTVIPTSFTVTGGGGSNVCNAGSCTSFNTGVGTNHNAIVKMWPQNVGSGFTSTPTINFVGGTCSVPPTASPLVVGINYPSNSSACFDHNMMPTSAFRGLVAMIPYPTHQIDPVNNSCDSTAGGGNLTPVSWYATAGSCTGNASNVGFLNFPLDSNCVEMPTGDLHLSSGSPGHLAGNDGLDIGANVDQVLGTSSGTPSQYTGISIANGVAVLPQ